MTRARSNAVSGTNVPFVGAPKSSGPAHASMIGAHRQPQQDPVLDMQQAVGNQATQQALGGYVNSTGNSVVPDEAVVNEPEGDSYASNFTMKPMKPTMKDMDKYDVQDPNPDMKTSLPSTTFYADTDEKRAPYARGFDEHGKMSSTANGAAINSIGAQKAGAIGAKENRHIFTMDGEGQFYTADAMQENITRGSDAAARGEAQQERVHHSTFLAGEAVAGAGEMQVRDGQVELVSDISGHYHPGSKQMIQTVQQLEKNKVQTERLGVEFIGKDDETKSLQASATELLGYGVNPGTDKAGKPYKEVDPNTAEEQMRAKHAQKNKVLDELLNSPPNLKPTEIGP